VRNNKNESNGGFDVEKPTYIGLLNAIANGERRGHSLFKNWSAATKDKRLKKTLDLVAIREMEHSWAFEKRLCELGFSLRAPADEVSRKAFEKQLKLLKSKASDDEKYASFGVGKRAKGKRGKETTDQLLSILANKTIDPITGELMGRFICEERDTGRRLREAYKATRAKGSKKGGRKKGSSKKAA
jgi:rubrerythrin